MSDTYTLTVKFSKYGDILAIEHDSSIEAAKLANQIRLASNTKIVTIMCKSMDYKLNGDIFEITYTINR